jgi:hypothetical protein
MSESFRRDEEVVIMLMARAARKRNFGNMPIYT